MAASSPVRNKSRLHFYSPVFFGRRCRKQPGTPDYAGSTHRPAGTLWDASERMHPRGSWIFITWTQRTHKPSWRRSLWLRSFYERNPWTPWIPRYIRTVQKRQGKPVPRTGHFWPQQNDCRQKRSGSVLRNCESRRSCSTILCILHKKENHGLYYRR